MVPAPSSPLGQWCLEYESFCPEVRPPEFQSCLNYQDTPCPVVYSWHPSLGRQPYLSAPSPHTSGRNRPSRGEPGQQSGLTGRARKPTERGRTGPGRAGPAAGPSRAPGSAAGAGPGPGPSCCGGTRGSPLRGAAAKSEGDSPSRRAAGAGLEAGHLRRAPLARRGAARASRGRCGGARAGGSVGSV